MCLNGKMKEIPKNEENYLKFSKCALGIQGSLTHRQGTFFQILLQFSPLLSKIIMVFRVNPFDRSLEFNLKIYQELT